MYRDSSDRSRRWSRNGPRARRSRFGRAKLCRTEWLQDQPLALAVFGQQADAVADRIPRMPNPHGPAIDEDPAGIGPVGAEHEPHGLGAAGSGQSGEPEHLAGVRAEAHLADRGRPATGPRRAAVRGRAAPPAWETPIRAGGRPSSRSAAVGTIEPPGRCPHAVRRARPSRGRPPRRSRPADG